MPRIKDINTALSIMATFAGFSPRESPKVFVLDGPPRQAAPPSLWANKMDRRINYKRSAWEIVPHTATGSVAEFCADSAKKKARKRVQSSRRRNRGA